MNVSPVDKHFICLLNASLSESFGWAELELVQSFSGLRSSKRKPIYHDLYNSVLRPAVVSVGHILLEGVKGMLLKCHWLLHFKVYGNLLNKCWYSCCLLFQSLEVIFLYHMYLYVCVCTWKDVCVVYFVHMYVSSFVPGMGIWKTEDHLSVVFLPSLTWQSYFPGT